jgi:septal ring factor EnvC (AmiA/AmiB activator)
MQDTMSKELTDATAAEEKAIKDFEALAAAKTAEINALTEEIESKLTASGELAVEIVNMKEDLDDTGKTLVEDKKFLAELEKGCDTKEAEWEERKKTRSDELLAIHETIGILNNDDALELFKKTLPAPALVQVKVSSKEVQTAALKALNQAKTQDPRVALISLTLRGGAKSFEKVIAMIDAMIKLLGEEQVSDDEKKTYCEKEIDTAEDDKKLLEQNLGDLAKAIDTTKESISTLADEIAELLKGIKDLDNQVKEATSTREEENAFYKQTMQEDSAAKEILKMAKNRLAKFYAPKMYQPPAKIERSAEGRIYGSEMGIAQATEDKNSAEIAATAMSMAQADPGPPPATWDAYKTKGEEHGGVVAMMDLLIADLDKEMSSMTTQEKDDQAEYEAFMSDAAAKRSADSKSSEQKAGEKAELEAALVKLQQDEKDKTKELYMKEMELKDLHMECDWLLTNFEVRKEARAGEVDSLKKAKAVLSGADYSL